jgi:hypothetical protein
MLTKAWGRKGKRRNLEDNIKIDRSKMGLEDVDWIHVAQDRAQW